MMPMTGLTQWRESYSHVPFFWSLSASSAGSLICRLEEIAMSLSLDMTVKGKAMWKIKFVLQKSESFSRSITAMDSNKPRYFFISSVVISLQARFLPLGIFLAAFLLVWHIIFKISASKKWEKITPVVETWLNSRSPFGSELQGVRDYIWVDFCFPRHCCRRHMVTGFGQHLVHLDDCAHDWGPVCDCGWHWFPVHSMT